MVAAARASQLLVAARRRGSNIATGGQMKSWSDERSAERLLHALDIVALLDMAVLILAAAAFAADALPR
jgi:hypothetical protein